MATALDRDDIIDGLRELIAGIRLVGGAALALRYFDRGTTQDLDSLHVHPGTDEAVAAPVNMVEAIFAEGPIPAPESLDPPVL